jgi:hypothetical protein
MEKLGGEWRGWIRRAEGKGEVPKRTSADRLYNGGYSREEERGTNVVVSVSLSLLSLEVLLLDETFDLLYDHERAHQTNRSSAQSILARK